MECTVNEISNAIALNGISVTTNNEDPLIEWVQIENPLYPTCITGYVIADQISGQSTTVNSTARSLTAQQLTAAGFPYCVSIRPTVTPLTSIGPIQAVNGLGELSLIDPGILCAIV